MEQWEYRQVTIGQDYTVKQKGGGYPFVATLMEWADAEEGSKIVWRSKPLDQPEAFDVARVLMARLGKGGWELVTAVDRDFYLFKHRIQA